jgi:putative ABC transport system permease protein
VTSTLDRKLLRDLYRVRGQALAIGVVIAVGVLLLVMMDGLIDTLEETRRTYYERYRFAEVFAPVKRAPARLLDDIAAIPGVIAVEGRVQGAALVDLPGIAVPILARAVSLPDFERPRLNDIYLSEGRWVDSSRSDEIILLQDFARTHELGPGDALAVTMNGARRTFSIVGLAQAPEFLYATPPGEVVPDDARFAVMWMSEEALEAAFDLNGAFNEALLSVAPGAGMAAVISQLDILLDPFGGTGAYDLRDHQSDRFIVDEIKGLQASGKVVPPIFLAVASFLLYIVITRMVQSEREQIGLLKAFGYSDWEVAWHYAKFILVIALGGAALGCLLGVLAGQRMGLMYMAYYKFPFMVFRVDPASFLLGVAASVAAASAGGLLVLRQVFALTPAVAMNPAAPPDYSRALRLGPTLKRLLDQPTRMVLRGLLRRPGRALLAVLGISAGMGLSVAMISVMGGFDRTLELNFSVIDRSDVTVTFIEPVSDKTIYELQRMTGVILVEPFRVVPAVLRNGLYNYRGAVNGFIASPQLNRALDEQQRNIAIRDDGIVLGAALADILHIEAGMTLTVEVREGRRPVLQIPVVAVAETLLGAPAYYQLDALNRALNEPHRVSGAFMRVDAAYAAALYRDLKDMPAVAGVSLRADQRAAFRKMLDTGAGAVRFVMAAIAAVITFGIVYNSARIAFAERARDLASLRVLGLSRSEAGFVLLGDLGIVTLLALPVGALLGYYLALAISSGFSTDLYRVPAMIVPESFGAAALAVIASAVVSGWLVKRDADRLDLATAIKTRE